MKRGEAALPQRNGMEPLTAGCLLCLRYFKNEHGVSIHVGKVHNRRPLPDDEKKDKITIDK